LKASFEALKINLHHNSSLNYDNLDGVYDSHYFAETKTKLYCKKVSSPKIKGSDRPGTLD